MSRFLHRSILLLCSCLLPVSGEGVPDCGARTVIVNVRDRSGNLLTGLNASNFRVTVGNDVVEVSSATFETASSRILLLLDSSGSMTYSKQKWAFATSVSADLLKSLPVEIPVALALFGDRVLDSIDLTHPRRDLQDKIHEVEDITRLSNGGWGRTAIRDSIQQAVTLLGTPRTGDSVYLVTDGESDVSRDNVVQLARTLVMKGIRLFIFVVEDEPPIDGDRNDSLDSIEYLAVVSGGEVLHLHDLQHGGNQKVRGNPRYLYDEMTRFYCLQIVNRSKRNGAISVHVVDSAGKRLKRVKWSYSHTELTCAGRQ